MRKTVYHCTGRNENQQPCPLSATNSRYKSLTQISQCLEETKKAQRGKVNTDTKPLTGIEFLRSMSVTTLPQGLASLTYKINKLVLVNKNTEAASGEDPSRVTPAEQQLASAMQHQPDPEKAVPPADTFQGDPARKGEKEEWGGNLGYDTNMFIQGGARIAPAAPPTRPGSSPKLRPVSAKGSYEGFSVTQLLSSREKWNRETCGEVDTTGIWQGLGKRRASITYARSAVVIPHLSQRSPSESNDTLGPQAPPTSGI